MKKRTMARTATVLLFLLIAVTGNHLFGQIKMTLDLNHKNYLQYEPIFARIVFLNRTNRFISFSDSDLNKGGKVTFLIQDEANNILPLRSSNTLPPTNGLTLRNGVPEKMTYCLSNYYKIEKRGKYRVKAILEHPQVEKRWESNTVTFTVGVGVTFFEKLVGVPDPDNKMKNRLRKYVMKRFFDGKDKIFYLIIEDQNFVYSVIRIGYDVGTMPDEKVDSMNRLHIVLQASPNVFSHFIYNYTGMRESKQVYYKTDLSPRLVADPKTGMVKVVGGKKALKDIHYKEDPGTIFGK